jgi:serine/threonine-protein kinase HipA
MYFATYRVLISGVLAGHLTRHPTGQIAFRLAASYQQLAKRPVLGQQFEDSPKAVFQGRRQQLPAFFANLVPEGQLRELLVHSLALPADDELALLNATGDDLPGAVEIVLADELLSFPLTTDEKQESILVEPSSKTNSLPGDDSSEGLRFSLAGVQMKFSVMRQEEKLLLPAHNHLGSWLAKAESLAYPHLATNEYAIMQWARAAGFDVPECLLLTAEALPTSLRHRVPAESNLFVIKRYDRDGNRRIHQEDFAQVMGRMPADKYDYVSFEQCASVVLGICGSEGYWDFIRRLIFMVATGNTDAHLKNWSLLYPDGINPQLAPVYDQVCTIAWPERLKLEWGLTFMKTRNLYAIDKKLFLRLIRVSGGDVATGNILLDETLASINAAWFDAHIAEMMPAAHKELLIQYWRRAPLLANFSL